MLQAEKVDPNETALELKGITKRFGDLIANDHIDFDMKIGEIHALLGENGAGKTTLMNILYGLYQPDEGEIYIAGKKVSIRSPKDAIDLGIGMVHQHFMLIPSLTVAENIILGLKSRNPFLNLKSAEKKIQDISGQYGMKVDPNAKIWQLSVGEQQRVEILKALYRGVRVLILDEPTAVLTGPETKELMSILKRMAKDSLGIVPFITHKLREVMAISDRVTVLRKGKVVTTIATKDTNEEDLAKKMVGRATIHDLKRNPARKGRVILEVKDLEALSEKGLPALKKVTFSLKEGEILGLAGVAGNGQRELLQVINGLRKATAGKIFIFGSEMTNRSPADMIETGIGYVPEDRHGTGSIADFSVSENLILKIHNKSPISNSAGLPFKKNWFLNHREIDNHAAQLIAHYNVMTPSTDAPARQLSGGNLQKLILARELSREPKLLVAAQPTRGLDVGATEDVRRTLLELREKGTGILLVSEDLDEIMVMSDRIAVIYEGEIMGIMQADEARIEEIGQMMGGIHS